MTTHLDEHPFFYEVLPEPSEAPDRIDPPIRQQPFIGTHAPLRPNLGLATTRELLDELRARAEIQGYADYRTKDPE